MKKLDTVRLNNLTKDTQPISGETWFKAQWSGSKATVQTTVYPCLLDKLQVYLLNTEKSSKALSGSPAPWQFQESLSGTEGGQDSEVKLS